METATQALHRLTSYAAYDEEQMWEPPVDDPRVVRDLVANDIDRLPWFYKRYNDAGPRIDLPRELPATTASAVDVLAGIASISPQPLDLAQLSRLLHLSAGVVRTSRRAYGEHLFRAAGSAGGRFPLEVYVAVPEGTTLPPGVHWYHPQDHALVQVGPPPGGDAAAVVVTGVPWRTGWRYRERGYRHVYWDSGTMLSQLLAAAASAGLTARLHSRFPDNAVSSLVGADQVHEWPVAVVALGDGTPALTPTGTAMAGAVDAAPVEFPLATAAQRAGVRDDLGPAWDPGPAAEVTQRSEMTVDTTVLTRGSQRLMDPDGSLPGDLLRTAMAAAMRGIAVTHWVVVNSVDGIASGAYRWPDLATPTRGGDLRAALYAACLDQGLGRDAAFVVAGTTDLTGLDDRAYRDAQLAGGLVEGRLHLLAYALGASASGMTFGDSLVPELLDAAVDTLLFTCVGVPEYSSTPGGLPGAPRSVRMITPRE